MPKPKQPRGGKIDFTIPEMFPLIESGAKCVTIRKHRKLPLEVGGILKVYLGNRYQGEQRYLGTAKILSLQDIEFYLNDLHRFCYLKMPDNTYFELNGEPLRELSVKDGFSSIDDFLIYHKRCIQKIVKSKQVITFGNQSWLN